MRAAVPDARVLALIESARGVAQACSGGRGRRASPAWSSARSTSRSTSTWTSRDSPDGLAYAASLHRDRLARRRPAGPGRRRHPAARRRGAPAGRPGVVAPPRLRRQAVHPPAPGRADPRRAAPRAPRPSTWARRVLAAEAASPGAARLDGRMIDRPVVLQAAAHPGPRRRLNPVPHSERTTMPSTIIDSAIFQGIFSSDDDAPRLVRREPHRRSTSTSKPRWPRCRAGSA